MSNVYTVDVMEKDIVENKDKIYDVSRYAFVAESDTESRIESFKYAFEGGFYKDRGFVCFAPKCRQLSEDVTSRNIIIKVSKASENGKLKEIDYAEFDPSKIGENLTIKFTKSNVKMTLSLYDDKINGYRMRQIGVL